MSPGIKWLFLHSPFEQYIYARGTAVPFFVVYFFTVTFFYCTFLLATLFLTDRGVPQPRNYKMSLGTTLLSYAYHSNNIATIGLGVFNKMTPSGNQRGNSTITSGDYSSGHCATGG